MAPKIVAYLRVSTDEQSQSGLGLEAQLASIEAKLGKPHSVHIDEGISGSKSNRPALHAALESLQKGDKLAVAKLDRLSRDSFLFAFISKEVERRGATIYSAADEGNGDSPTDVLMRQIVMAFAAYEREMIRSRTSAALAAKRAKREKTGGITPYGFQSIDGTLSPHPSEYPVLLDMLAMRDAGLSLRAIGAELERRKIPSKTGKAHWAAKTISDTLSNKSTQAYILSCK